MTAPTEHAVSYELFDGVAVLTIDHPPVNALASAVTVGLTERLQQAADDSAARAIVLTGAGGKFVAGADITRLEALAAGAAPAAPPGALSLPEILERIAGHDKPVVAAIDGFALGGGLELALSCSHRVATAKARVGLPELQLGIIPGAGGTQRLPRLVGIAAAAEMMLSSKPIRASEALSSGVVDAIVDAPAELVAAACQLARDIADGRTARRRVLELEDTIEHGDEALGLLDEARRRHARSFRNVDYPELCLQAIATGALEGPEAGLKRERAAFEEALGKPAAQGLIHLFFAQRQAPKVPGVTDCGLSANGLERVGVLGGGTMGAGIATALVNAGVEVRLKEVNAEQAQKARTRVEKNVRRDETKGRIGSAEAEARLDRLTTQDDYTGFRELDLVIEAATENVELKQQLFSELKAETRADCLLATNTSTIDIDRIGDGLGLGGRLLGTHFFSPAHIMPLVELIRTADTSSQALVDVLALTKRLRKTPVVVGNCVGFLVNRVFMPYGQRVGFLIDRGVDPYRIDRAMVAFGMPMGPCRVSDLAGVDVGVFAGSILDAAYPERSYRSQLRKLLADAGRIGEKAGLGHYRYEVSAQGGKPAAVEDDELAGFVTRARELAGNPPAVSISDDDIVQLLLFGVVNEACRCLEEQVVIRASDIDVAITQGMGFPRYRGGPMKWADGFGAAHVRDVLQRWYDDTGHQHFEPSTYLLDRAKRGSALV